MLWESYEPFFPCIPVCPDSERVNFHLSPVHQKEDPADKIIHGFSGIVHGDAVLLRDVPFRAGPGRNAFLAAYYTLYRPHG